ncbi:hypothetical protein CONLIGDRAFT_228227 [Coniochaeta ligniaria NRRL 30616]|uniref:Uncharacterized protein n=1 Tax=Coniochaeta ligniaria NRRL 30616 TaxID=1408157 RepID=A0A1J7JNU8_9PEZI|nr:hypothetical protein CONLIGDRAFT_228227 [Coniochaeta ligniaria NRRL 30616]
MRVVVRPTRESRVYQIVGLGRIQVHAAAMLYLTCVAHIGPSMGASISSCMTEAKTRTGRNPVWQRWYWCIKLDGSLRGNRSGFIDGYLAQWRTGAVLYSDSLSFPRQRSQSWSSSVSKLWRTVTLATARAHASLTLAPSHTSHETLGEKSSSRTLLSSRKLPYASIQSATFRVYRLIFSSLLSASQVVKPRHMPDHAFICSPCRALEPSAVKPIQATVLWRLETNGRKPRKRPLVWLNVNERMLFGARGLSKRRAKSLSVLQGPRPQIPSHCGLNQSHRVGILAGVVPWTVNELVGRAYTWPDGSTVQPQFLFRLRN